MNTKNLLTFQAIVAILFGLTLIFVPKTLLGPYLTDPSDLNQVGQLLGSMYGAALIGIGVGCWVAREATHPKSWLYAILFANGFNIYIYTEGIISGHFNSLLWSSLILVIVLALWAAYLLYVKKPVN